MYRFTAVDKRLHASPSSYGSCVWSFYNGLNHLGFNKIWSKLQETIKAPFLLTFEKKCLSYFCLYPSIYQWGYSSCFAGHIRLCQGGPGLSLCTYSAHRYIHTHTVYTHTYTHVQCTHIHTCMVCPSSAHTASNQPPHYEREEWGGWVRAPHRAYCCVCR